MTMSRRFRSLVLTLALPAAFALVACSSDIDTPQEIAVGSYQLLLVNGDTLPVQTGEQDGYLWVVLAGSIVAKSDQTCEFRHTYRYTSVADQTVREESEVSLCTWQLIEQGFHVRFPGNGALLSGLLAQNALWFDFPGNDNNTFRFMYQRTGDAPRP
jgi:hypothetical protein